MMTQRPSTGSLRSSEVKIPPKHPVNSRKIYSFGAKVSPGEAAGTPRGRPSFPPSGRTIVPGEADSSRQNYRLLADTPGAAGSFSRGDFHVHFLECQLLPTALQPNLKGGARAGLEPDLLRG